MISIVEAARLPRSFGGLSAVAITHTGKNQPCLAGRGGHKSSASALAVIGEVDVAARSNGGNNRQPAVAAAHRRIVEIASALEAREMATNACRSA